MAMSALFQMLILALYLTLLISSRAYIDLVQVLVQNLLLQRTTTSEDVRICRVQCIYIKNEKIKLFLTGLFSLSHFIQFSFVTLWFC